MAEFDFSKTYYIQVNNSRDDYDFTKKGYPLSFKAESSKLRYFIPANGFYLLIGNRSMAELLPLDVDMAEKYENRSKGNRKNGYSSPLVYTIVYLTLKDKRMEIPKDKYEVLNLENKYRTSFIGADVKGVEVYNHPSFKYNLIGSLLSK